jgi:hypothetical protein
MKVAQTTLMILVMILIVAALALLSKYDKRMEEYNKHVCATYGKEADCKTPLKEGERLQ